ncbi:MAG: hypothetical protein ACOYN0_15265, partial [Phycisphaerales bacterium]
GTQVLTGSADDTPRIWDAATGASLAKLKRVASSEPKFLVNPSGGKTALVGVRVCSAAYSPDGKRIATASNDYSVHVWDSATGTELRELKGHKLAINSATFSADSTLIVTASFDNTAMVWDAATGARVAILEGHTEPLVSAAFSRDGTRVVTASFDHTARVWDAATGAGIAVLEGHSEPLVSAVFNADGTRVLSASYDKSARVWDAATGASILELRGHTGGVTSAAYSQDCTRIVTASSDNTARIWDAATGVSFAELKGHANAVVSAAFSPDGKRILTASADNTARVWDSVAYHQRFPALSRARAARIRIFPLVKARLESGEPVESIRAAFAAEPGLTLAERNAAMVETQSAIDQSRAEARQLAASAWKVVRLTPASPAAAAKALGEARRAVLLSPGEGHHLNTLGVALYRAGELKEALETLLRADQINVANAQAHHPSDLAFIAMARFKLGLVNDARADLAAFLALAEEDLWKNDEEVRAWIKEAQDLIR